MPERPTERTEVSPCPQPQERDPALFKVPRWLEVSVIASDRPGLGGGRSSLRVLTLNLTEAARFEGWS